MRITTTTSRLAAALAFSAAILSGCGGGGDGGVAAPPPQALFNVEASLAQLFQAGGEFELAGRDAAGNEMRRMYRFVPGLPADPRVPGALATRVDEWAPVSPEQAIATTYYYTVNPFRLVARTLGTSSMMHYTQTAEIPASAGAGSDAEFGYGQEPQSPQIERARWQVRHASASGTAWVCLETAQIRSGGFLCALAGPQGTARRRRAGAWWTGSSYDLQ